MILYPRFETITEKIELTSQKNINNGLNDHPHMLSRRQERESNCIYIAREKLSWNEGQAGYGLLPFDEKRVLTKKGYSRSKWDLPDFLRDKKITYHSPASWKKDYFQSAHRGQEFVVDENPDVECWAKKLIED